MTCFYLSIPENPELYPINAIRAGLAKIGWEQIFLAKNTSPSDVLVTWSPWHYMARGLIADRWTGPIIVVENGWLQPIAGLRYWSVCLWGWNGSGQWKPEDDFGLRLNKHIRPITPLLLPRNNTIVVVEQRGSAHDARTMPPKWHVSTASKLSKSTIRYKDDPEPIWNYLIRTAPRGVVTWSSAVASWAVLLGIPTVYSGPSIWCWQLATRWDGNGEPDFVNPPQNNRQMILSHLAWSQWTKEELASGRPFDRLINPTVAV